MAHISEEIKGTIGEELEGKVIVHCITSSISCYLAPQISRKLMRHGARVIPVLSKEAANFVDPMIFEWATGEIPITKIEGKVEHVLYAGLSQEKADMILVAPITANSISKIANGIMDTTVTLIAGTALGNNIPVVMVPAMHEVMLNNPAVEKNILELRDMGVSFILPRLEEEKAKIPDEEEICENVIRILSKRSFENKKFLVTAGPTRAYLDKVRYISNPSSGKMGYAIALEAWREGAEVTLVYGSSLLSPPKVLGVQIKAEKPEEMYERVCETLKSDQYDYVILAAAMNDFEPEEIKNEKISSSQELEIKFKAVKKLADEIKNISPLSKLILFKAESNKTEEELIKIALERMEKADASMIVANDIADKKYGFESEYNKVVIITSEESFSIVEGTKIKVAKKIIEKALEL